MPRADLDAVLAALDERARSEPRLESYRVEGNGPGALADVPPGWFVSDVIARFATEGGWWPGFWRFPILDDLVSDVVTVGSGLEGQESTVRWAGVGDIWERDHFYTPMLRERAQTAPLFGFSSQALWKSMVFPTEVALLEAFVVTYDELGLDEFDEVNPFFVEWVTKAPNRSEPDGAVRVHLRLAERSTRWTTDHPCWLSGAMPRLDGEVWPPELVEAILGINRAP
jgi:hypothetical protein